MRKTKELILGAMCASLVAILVLLNVLVGGYLLLFIPLPLMYYGRKASFRNMIMAYVTSVFLVFILSGLGYALLVFGYGAVALTYIAIRNKGGSKLTMFLGSALINVLNFVLMIFTFSSIIGVDLTEDIDMIMRWFGISSGPTLAIILIVMYGFLALAETWIIIFAFETFEVLLNRIEK